MTDQAVSPLRRRMIEDMTIRNLAPKTQQRYIRDDQELRRLSRPLARYGDRRRCSAFSVASCRRTAPSPDASTARFRRCGFSSALRSISPRSSST